MQLFNRLFVLSSFIAVPLASFGQAADGLFTRAGRPYLAPPAEIWQQVQRSVGREDRPMGYSFEEMLGYPTFEHRLRTVENLFRDILAPSEYGGLMGNNLLACANEPAQLCFMLWSQLEARAGREWAVPKEKGDWGYAGIPKGATPQAVVDKLVGTPDGKGPRLMLTGLDERSQKLVARILVAVQVSQPFLSRASGPPHPYSSPDGMPWQVDMPRKLTYDLLVSPYLGDVNDDTIKVENRQAYDAMRYWDANYSAFGSALFLRHFDASMVEYNSATPGKISANFKTIRFQSFGGSFVIGGTGSDVHKGGGIVIDFGGNDSYSGLIGAPSSSLECVSISLDLGGNDTYDGTSIDGNIGCGLFGLGLVYDAAGNDTYKVKNGGIGFGLYGTGIVIDRKGNDTYEAKKGWSQGAAYAGVGLLLDNEGDDKYRTICMSMGFGGTRGIGALVDVSGNDDYFTADSGNDSKAWGKTVSMTLGCGYGRRCDSGDGQNQGGGIGIVVEGAGDDKYHTGIFTLGSGYWWGAGIFEERGGNDTYRCTHYSIGSAAHFAVGSFVDLAGDDKYNDRPDAVERWAAIGRDGSMAVCIDADGDDVWGNLTGGHSDLNSYALFWDKHGNDNYKRMQPFDPAVLGNRPFGSAATYPQFHNFRDRLASVGIFLDTQGADQYPTGMTAEENKTWQLQNGPLFWGYGVDGNFVK
jgi:hypothetical protein